MILPECSICLERSSYASSKLRAGTSLSLENRLQGLFLCLVANECMFNKCMRHNLARDLLFCEPVTRLQGKGSAHPHSSQTCLEMSVIEILGLNPPSPRPSPPPQLTLTSTPIFVVLGLYKPHFCSARGSQLGSAHRRC